MYDKLTFGKSLGASFGVLAVIVLVVLSTSTAFAVPLAGVGGFQVTADKITADSMVIYPGVADTSNQDAYPMAVIEQKNVRISGMKLMKELSVDSVPGLSGDARFVMTTEGTVKAEEQMIKVSQFGADTGTFNQQVIDETNSDNPSRAFGIWSGDAAENEDKIEDGRIIDIKNDGKAQILENAKINVHYLASNKLIAPGLGVKLQYDSDGDGNYNE